jgi:phosphatidylserine/phosphatidylglycerophosphate/cardiolipin synthase-like enzyme
MTQPRNLVLVALAAVVTTLAGCASIPSDFEQIPSRTWQEPESTHLGEFFSRYAPDDPELNFVDLDVLAVGPAAKDAGIAFDDYWNSPAAVPIAAHPNLHVFLLEGSRPRQTCDPERGPSTQCSIPTKPSVRPFLKN